MTHPQTTTTRSWQSALQTAITDAGALCKALNLNPATLGINTDPHAFPLKVPQSFVARMCPGDPTDPLLRQVLVSAQEALPTLGYTTDPLDEKTAMQAPGLMHKYHDRVLIIPSGSCAVHCRYCFRRHFPYDDHALAQRDWQRWWTYLNTHPEIEEVILSGGDPLMLKDELLTKLFTQIKAHTHIQRIRIHTRLPVVIPQRLTTSLKTQLSQHNALLVLHCNHANELQDDTLQSKLLAYKQAGITLLNQSVLLRGVNDSHHSLAALSKTLWHAGVLPYYLHLLDPVAGTAHFQVSTEEALALHASLKASLAGYLVPKLVREAAGIANKVWVHQSIPTKSI